MTHQDPHIWFSEHIGAFVIGDLSGDELARMNAHVIDCDACAQLLAESKSTDAQLRKLFASANPTLNFEDKLIMNLQPALSNKSLKLNRTFSHPLLRASAGIAATLLLASVGWYGQKMAHGGKMPMLKVPSFAFWNSTKPELATRSNPTTSVYFRDPGLTVLSSSTAANANGEWNEKDEASLWDRENDSRNYTRHTTKTGTGTNTGGLLDIGSHFLYVANPSGLQTKLRINDGYKNVNTLSRYAFEAGRDKGAVNNLYVKGRYSGGELASDGITLTGGTIALSTLSDAYDRDTEGKSKREDTVSNLPAIATTDSPHLAKALAKIDSEPKSVEEMPRQKLEKQLETVAKHERGLQTETKAGRQSVEVKLAQADQRKLVEEKFFDAVVVEENKQEAKNEPQPDEKPNAKPDPAAVPVNNATAAAQKAQRHIIRNGNMDFEVESFDNSFIQINKIAAEEGGFVSSTDSEKLPNGKVKGTVVVRVPPDRLDVLVLKLRGLGDLKTQKIAAQDITKQYTDLESSLRASRIMETRLLEIIKSGKGEVKDLVEAEKQLGIYREKIEQIEGELRYYSNMVSLSTLNVTLYEKDIKTPTAAFETETVNAGIETEDVEKARNDALKAIEEVKGRVIESNLKKLDAGQYTATIIAEVAPEAAGSVIDRLKQLGNVTRLEADRKQTTTGGQGAPTGVKMQRKPTVLNISLYNLANISPRETVNMTIAATSVEQTYQAILDVLKGDEATSGRIISKSLITPKPDQVTGSIMLEIKTDKIAMIEPVLRTSGDVMNMTISENSNSSSVTRTKRGYSISLVSAAQIPPRETQTLQVAAKDVPATYARILTLLQDSKTPSRIFSSQLNEQDRQNINSMIEVDVPRTLLNSVLTALRATDSEIYSRNVSRANDTQNTLDNKVHLSIATISAERMAFRQLTRMTLEVDNVEKILSDLINTANTANARIFDQQINKQQSGRTTARAIIDLPLTGYDGSLDKFKNLGTVKAIETTKNDQVSDGPLARARFEVTITNKDLLIAPEDGMGARVRQGLATSLNYLGFSLMLIVVGVCLIGPFAIAGWIGLKLFKRKRKVAPVTTA